MERLKKYIDIYTIDIPKRVRYGPKSITKALVNDDINLVKSLIAYKNYIKKMKKDYIDMNIEELLYDD